MFQGRETNRQAAKRARLDQFPAFAHSIRRLQCQLGHNADAFGCYRGLDDSTNRRVVIVRKQQGNGQFEYRALRLYHIAHAVGLRRGCESDDNAGFRIHAFDGQF
ncbi:hypothetical protein Q4543_04705 [Salipiger sp. 1_MG-2023]|nr:hypothetical protein [Salipiger sp. 1_MG-2023]MDO6584812.1 hypothetical protein [Salipiger sp. 1_MG-2023]